MELLNLPLIPLILINLALGFFVLANNKRSVVNQSFFGLIIFVSIWILSNFLIDNLKNHSYVLFWTRFSYVAGIFIPLFYLYFSAAFRGIFTTFKSLTYLIKTGVIPVFFAFLSLSSLVVTDISINENGVNLITGPGLTFYFIVFLCFMILGSYHLFVSYRQGDALKKLQLKYFLFGTLLTAVFVSIINFIIPAVFQNWALATYTPYFTVIMLVSIAYAIVRHRLLDIEVIIRRSLVYSTLLAILIAMYSGLVFVLNSFFLPGETGVFPRVTDVIAIILVAFTIDPLRRIIERSTDKVFFKARYNAEETINQLSETLVTEIDLTHLVREISLVLRNSIKVDKLSIYIKSDHTYFPAAIVNTFPKKLDTIVEK